MEGHNIRPLRSPDHQGTCPGAPGKTAHDEGPKAQQTPKQQPGIGRRNKEPARKKGSRTCSRQCRVLCLHVLGTKKGWRYKTGVQLKATERPHGHKILQDGHSGHRLKLYQTRRLGGLPRHQGCIPSCAHTSKTQKVPTLPAQGQEVPIQSPPLRPKHGSPNLYKDNRANNKTLQGKRNQINPLPGRWTNPSPRQKDSIQAQGLCSRTYTKPGIYHQLEEVGPRTNTTMGLSGPELGCQISLGGSTYGQNKKDPEYSQGPNKELESLLQSIAVFSRQFELRLFGYTTRPVAHKATSEMPSQSLQIAQGLIQTLPSDRRGRHSSDVVDSAPEPIQTPTNPSAGDHNYHRLQQSRMGGGMGSQEVEGHMAQENQGAHQLFGTESGVVNTGRMGTELTRTLCVSTSRQQDSSGLPPQGRGDQVQETIRPGQRHSVLVPRLADNLNPILHPGPGQLGSGRGLPRQGGGRVDTRSTSIQTDMQEMGQTGDRSVCQCSNTPVRTLLHSPERGQQGTGSGRTPTEVGEPGTSIRLPTSATDTQGPGQDHTGPSGGRARGPMLAGRGLVRRTHFPAEGQAQEDIPIGSLEPDHRPVIAERRETPADGMEAFHMAVTTRYGLPEPVVDRLQNSLRQSTWKNYQTGWTAWRNWCVREGVDSLSPSVKTLLNFLQYQFSDMQASQTALAGYRSAICSITQPGVYPTVGAHPLITRFLKACLEERPPRLRLTPRVMWDVAQVLTTLRDWGIPANLSIARLTWKTATLVALLAAQRCGDLTLFRRDQAYLRISTTAAVLQPQWGAKKDRFGHQKGAIILRKELDERLCPVAHIKEYIQRIQPDQGQPPALFVTTTDPHRPAASGTIRRWVVNALREAGVQDSAGSTRAAAATYALVTNTSIKRIMEAADWSTARVMYNHYTRQLPPEALQRIVDQTQDVQRAVMSQLPDPEEP